MHTLKFIAIFFGISLIIVPMKGQSPYHIMVQQEHAIFAGAATLFGVSYYAKSRVSEWDVQQINQLDKNNVSRLDRWSINRYNQNAKKLSDISLAATHLAGGFLLLYPEIRKEIPDLAVLYGQVFLTSTSLTLLTKYAAQRPRPYLYNPNVPLSEKVKVDGRTSFFSGHTSMTASHCFFVARVYQDFYPERKSRYAVWAGAIVAPAVVGYLRMDAGRHFLSDIGVGYMVGALVGAGIPIWHRKIKTGFTRQWHLEANPMGLSLSWKPK